MHIEFFYHAQIASVAMIAKPTKMSMRLKVLLTSFEANDEGIISVMAT